MGSLQRLESDLEKQCSDWIYDRGGLCLKIKLENTRGFPDRLILLNDKIAFVEFKRPGGGIVSPHQEVWLTRLNSYSRVSAAVVDDYDYFKGLFE